MNGDIDLGISKALEGPADDGELEDLDDESSSKVGHTQYLVNNFSYLYELH